MLILAHTRPVFAESIIVHGHVQGVGFRAYVQRIANACGVDCSVRNASDGTVRVTVKHPDSEAQYGCFCRQLAEGPGCADFLFFQGFEPEEAV